MKKIFILLLAFSFLFSLGKRQDRKEFEIKPKLLAKGTWDGVVDTVGGNILANAISQTKHSGIIAACGNASGNTLNTSVIPFLAVINGRQKLDLKEFLRPSQLGILLAVAAFWWSHRFISTGIELFSSTKLSELLT